MVVVELLPSQVMTRNETANISVQYLISLFLLSRGGSPSVLVNFDSMSAWGARFSRGFPPTIGLWSAWSTGAWWTVLVCAVFDSGWGVCCCVQVRSTS